MSKNDKSPEVTSNSKYSLVRAIVTLFKLGEEGKVENFFAKQRKAMGRDTSKLEKEKEVAEFNHKNAMEDLDDQISDAKLAVDNAYTQVDVDSLATNASSDAFAQRYWSAIESAESALDILETRKEDAVESHKESMEEIQDQIDERQRRMDRISAEK